jgi:hypothetical protein
MGHLLSVLQCIPGRPLPGRLVAVVSAVRAQTDLPHEKIYNTVIVGNEKRRAGEFSMVKILS